MPGGTPAGTVLGLELFLIYFNYAGPMANTKLIGSIITKPLSTQNSMSMFKVKWVDDMTIGTAINLKEALVQDDWPDIPRPVPYHSRTGHYLPTQANRLQ